MLSQYYYLLLLLLLLLPIGTHHSEPLRRIRFCALILYFVKK